MKNGCFRTLKTSSGCSWTWRKLLNLRSLARPFIKDIIGDGQRTFPCHDNCTPTLRVLISVLESWRLQDSYKCQKIPPLFAMINGCWHVAISFFTPSKFPTPLSQVRSDQVQQSIYSSLTLKVAEQKKSYLETYSHSKTVSFFGWL